MCTFWTFIKYRTSFVDGTQLHGIKIHLWVVTFWAWFFDNCMLFQCCFVLFFIFYQPCWFRCRCWGCSYFRNRHSTKTARKFATGTDHIFIRSWWIHDRSTLRTKWPRGNGRRGRGHLICCWLLSIVVGWRWTMVHHPTRPPAFPPIKTKTAQKCQLIFLFSRFSHASRFREKWRRSCCLVVITSALHAGSGYTPPPRGFDPLQNHEEWVRKHPFLHFFDLFFFLTEKKQKKEAAL